MKTITFLWMALFVIVAAAANAQQTTAAPPASCQQDMATLCKGVQPGPAPMGDCLIENRGKIQNAQCKSTITQLSQEEQMVQSACTSDIQSKCANKVGVELLDCLHQNTNSLASGCKSALPK